MPEKLASILFGGSCFLCRGAAREALCGECEAELPWLPEAVCPRCALASPGGALCGRCLAEPPRFDATLAALWYRFPADVLVQSLKFGGALPLARYLASLLARRIARGERVDCVVPVPLAAARLRGRGYNQAAEIARRLGAAGVELALCERTRDGPPQMELPFAERQRNVHGAFRVRRSLAGATVAVVDDVMTTGATLDELARALKGAGAARVVNWVLARTPPHA